MTIKTIPVFTFASDLPVVGQPLADGIFVTRFWLNADEFALIDLGAEQEFVGEWGLRGRRVNGAKSYRDGAANTLEMADAGSPIANQVLEIGAGVYIPSALELNMLFAANNAGEISGFRNRWYWTSTQCSDPLSFYPDLGDGLTRNDVKYYSFRVRPVRKIPILQRSLLASCA